MQKKKGKNTTQMTEEQLAAFEKMLKDEQYRLTLQVRGRMGDLTSSKQAGDEAPDIGGDEFRREIGWSLVASDAEKLGMIAEALKHIQNGSYGICQDCGKMISAIRLQAKPHARYCIDCKTIREQKEG